MAASALGIDACRKLGLTEFEQQFFLTTDDTRLIDHGQKLIKTYKLCLSTVLHDVRERNSCIERIREMVLPGDSGAVAGGGTTNRAATASPTRPGAQRSGHVDRSKLVQRLRDLAQFTRNFLVSVCKWRCLLWTPRPLAYHHKLYLLGLRHTVDAVIQNELVIRLAREELHPADQAMLFLGESPRPPSAASSTESSSDRRQRQAGGVGTSGGQEAREVGTDTLSQLDRFHRALLAIVQLEPSVLAAWEELAAERQPGEMHVLRFWYGGQAPPADERFTDVTDAHWAALACGRELAAGASSGGPEGPPTRGGDPIMDAAKPKRTVVPPNDYDFRLWTKVKQSLDKGVRVGQVGHLLNLLLPPTAMKRMAAAEPAPLVVAAPETSLTPEQPSARQQSPSHSSSELAAVQHTPPGAVIGTPLTPQQQKTTPAGRQATPFPHSQTMQRQQQLQSQGTQSPTQGLQQIQMQQLEQMKQLQELQAALRLQFEQQQQQQQQQQQLLMQLQSHAVAPVQQQASWQYSAPMQVQLAVQSPPPQQQILSGQQAVQLQQQQQQAMVVHQQVLAEQQQQQHHHQHQQLGQQQTLAVAGGDNLRPFQIQGASSGSPAMQSTEDHSRAPSPNQHQQPSPGAGGTTKSVGEEGLQSGAAGAIDSARISVGTPTDTNTPPAANTGQLELVKSLIQQTEEKEAQRTSVIGIVGKDVQLQRLQAISQALTDGEQSSPVAGADDEDAFETGSASSSSDSTGKATRKGSMTNLHQLKAMNAALRLLRSPEEIAQEEARQLSQLRGSKYGAKHIHSAKRLQKWWRAVIANVRLQQWRAMVTAAVEIQRIARGMRDRTLVVEQGGAATKVQRMWRAKRDYQRLKRHLRRREYPMLVSVASMVVPAEGTSFKPGQNIVEQTIRRALERAQEDTDAAARQNDLPVSNVTFTPEGSQRKPFARNDSAETGSGPGEATVPQNPPGLFTNAPEPGASTSASATAALQQTPSNDSQAGEPEGANTDTPGTDESRAKLSIHKLPKRAPPPALASARLNLAGGSMNAIARTASVGGGSGVKASSASTGQLPLSRASSASAAVGDSSSMGGYRGMRSSMHPVSRFDPASAIVSGVVVEPGDFKVSVSVYCMSHFARHMRKRSAATRGRSAGLRKRSSLLKEARNNPFGPSTSMGHPSEGSSIPSPRNAAEEREARKVAGSRLLGFRTGILVEKETVCVEHPPPLSFFVNKKVSYRRSTASRTLNISRYRRNASFHFADELIALNKNNGIKKERSNAWGDLMRVFSSDARDRGGDSDDDSSSSSSVSSASSSSSCSESPRSTPRAGATRTPFSHRQQGPTRPSSAVPRHRDTDASGRKVAAHFRSRRVIPSEDDGTGAKQENGDAASARYRVQGGDTKEAEEESDRDSPMPPSEAALSTPPPNATPSGPRKSGTDRMLDRMLKKFPSRDSRDSRSSGSAKNRGKERSRGSRRRSDTADSSKLGTKVRQSWGLVEWDEKFLFPGVNGRSYVLFQVYHTQSNRLVGYSVVDMLREPGLLFFGGEYEVALNPPHMDMEDLHSLFPQDMPIESFLPRLKFTVKPTDPERSKCGFLWLRTGSWASCVERLFTRPRWSRIWCVLSSETIYFYERKDSEQPFHTVNVQSVVSVEPVPVQAIRSERASFERRRRLAQKKVSLNSGQKFSRKDISTAEDNIIIIVYVAGGDYVMLRARERNTRRMWVRAIHNAVFKDVARASTRRRETFFSQGAMALNRAADRIRRMSTSVSAMSAAAKAAAIMQQQAPLPKPSGPS